MNAKYLPPTREPTPARDDCAAARSPLLASRATPAGDWGSVFSRPGTKVRSVAGGGNGSCGTNQAARPGRSALTSGQA